MEKNSTFAEKFRKMTFGTAKYRLISNLIAGLVVCAVLLILKFIGVF